MHYTNTLKAAMPSTTLCGPTHPHSNPSPQALARAWQQLSSWLRPIARPPSDAPPPPPALPPPSPAAAQAAAQAHANPRARKLKQDLAAVLAALPATHTMGTFDRDVWLQSIADAATPVALRRCLGQLEDAIIPSFVSPLWTARNPGKIHKVAWSSPNRLQVEAAAAAAAGEDAGPAAVAPSLQWLPPTYAAVAFRLAALDAALK